MQLKSFPFFHLQIVQYNILNSAFYFGCSTHNWQVIPQSHLNADERILNSQCVKTTLSQLHCLHQPQNILVVFARKPSLVLLLILRIRDLNKPLMLSIKLFFFFSFPHITYSAPQIVWLVKVCYFFFKAIRPKKKKIM